MPGQSNFDLLINQKGLRLMLEKSDHQYLMEIIDQRELPFSFTYLKIQSSQDCFSAIRDMAVRGFFHNFYTANTR